MGAFVLQGRTCPSLTSKQSGRLQIQCLLTQDKSFLSFVNIEETAWVFKNETKRGPKGNHSESMWSIKLSIFHRFLNLSYWRRSLSFYISYLWVREIFTHVSIFKIIHLDFFSQVALDSQIFEVSSSVSWAKTLFPSHPIRVSTFIISISPSLSPVLDTVE